ncbi:hypothetical protein POVCU1_036950 [Plasmodium ovale curtisi]|uniref:Uncharacterized protein n=1 Tax=Plasmodium ovale curtisi TaxID=864141 RepID=A0A1A8WZF7_PLAOA|nr:hypothetical protein POVCU1_036950 [Plasmodium ovale curtisi]
MRTCSSSFKSNTKKDECSESVFKKEESSNLIKCEKEPCNNGYAKICKLTCKNSSVKCEKNNGRKKQIKQSESSSKDSIKEESPMEEEEEENGMKMEEMNDEEGGGGEDGDLEFADARKYFKEGQKLITPPNGDGTRAFYESLLEENPNSIIAIKYCIEYGVLSGTKHHETLCKYDILKKNNAFRNNFGGVKGEFVKLLEDSKESDDCSFFLKN